MKRVFCLALALILLVCCGCTKHTSASYAGTCTISISCAELVGNKALKASKQGFVPSDGEILHETAVSFYEGESVFDVLRRTCEENVCADNCTYCQADGIQLEYAYTPGYGTYYIEGVHNLYEKDCGSMSGWVFSVNGKSAVTGCSETAVQDGDVIEWQFTCG